jgi:hypothetical protein
MTEVESIINVPTSLPPKGRVLSPSRWSSHSLDSVPCMSWRHTHSSVQDQIRPLDSAAAPLVIRPVLLEKEVVRGRTL